VTASSKRILIVQYAGDYLAAYNRLQTSGTETYYGHRYLLEQLGHIAQTVGETAILCCKSDQTYDQLLPSGLRIIGAGPQKHWNTPETMRIVKDFNPTHLIILGPLTQLIRWGLKTQRKILCLFADSFEIHPLRRLIRYGRIASLLNDERIEWIANHGLSSCLSLAKIGVKRDKIIPWDWPYIRQPKDNEPKQSAGTEKPSLFFAGLISERKGVRDLITAVAILKKAGILINAKLAGAGEIEKFRAVAEAQGVGQDIEFLGLIPNTSVVDYMRAASIVVVPSQHAYPEGLPLTIYEALCARTPIVASDHPMFVRRLSHRESAMIYKAGKPAELADCIKELLSNSQLYHALSANSQHTWESLQIPVKWGDLISAWLSEHADKRQWLYENRLENKA